MQKFNNKETEFIADLSNPGKDTLENFIRKSQSLSVSIEGKFEGHNFPIPKDYDEVLTNAYGDYMTLPIESERVSHHDIVKVKL